MAMLTLVVKSAVKLTLLLMLIKPAIIIYVCGMPMASKWKVNTV